MAYIPPSLSGIPFNFTNSGYVPDYNNLDINFISSVFSSLQSTIVGSPLYINETFTYVKSCKSVAIGYGASTVQILKLPCSYGGIRDLSSVVNALGVVNSNDLTARIDLHAPVAIVASIRSINSGSSSISAELIGALFTGACDLSSFLAGILPSTLSASIRSIQSSLLDIFAEVTPQLFKSSKDISSFIEGHLSYILYSSIGGHLSDNLQAILSTHTPLDLFGYLRPFYFKELFANIGSNLPKDLTSILNAHSPTNLYSTINSHLAVSFFASINTHTPIDLYGHLRAFKFIDITSYIGMHSTENLTVELEGHLPVNLQAVLEGHLSSYITSTIDTHISIDINSYLHAFQYKDLFSLVSGHAPFDLDSVIGAHPASFIYSNISIHTPAYMEATIEGCFPYDLYGYLHAYQYKDILANIQTSFPIELPALIATHAPDYLYSEIDTHIYNYLYSIIDSHTPEFLYSVINTHTPSTLLGNISAWDILSIGGYIQTHPFIDIISYIDVFQHTFFDLNGSIHSWQEAYLSGSLTTCFSYDLYSNVMVVLPSNLYAYLNVWSMSDFISTIMGWDFIDISAMMHIFQKKDLQLFISSHSYVNLKGIIRITTSGFSDITNYIRVFQYKDLLASLHTFYIKDITSYIYPVSYEILHSAIHGYAEAFLYGSLYANVYPYDLTATIFANGSFLNLYSYIRAVAALNINADLIANIHGYYYTDISALLYPIVGYDLGANIVARGFTSVLYATLVPKIVKLSKIVSIMTMESLALSAMINTGCFSSNYNDLFFYLKATYVSSISAVIKGVILYKEDKDLCATIGYDNSVITTDKLSFSINTNDGAYFVTDMLPISLRVIGDFKYLQGAIKGMHHVYDLSATISGIKISPYVFENPTSKALVYDIAHRTGRPTLHRIVELSFRAFVEEYIYLSKGNVIFSTDFNRKWSVDVISYLPANISLNLKRRFYRATVIYKLTSYNSIDDAVTAAIKYVTEVPFAMLSASINLNYNSMGVSLSAAISPIYVHRDTKYLLSSITPVYPEIVVSLGESGDLFKL